MRLAHGTACAEDPCDWCQRRAEERAENTEPDFDETTAENSFEAASGW